MTQEDKQLLFKELCARLPYKVIIKSVGENKIIGLWDLRDIDNLPLPYLRPLSSMTEEERKEHNLHRLSKWSTYSEYCANVIDWLNAHHIDYRGLIYKNLALDCTGLHIYDY